MLTMRSANTASAGGNSNSNVNNSANAAAANAFTNVTDLMYENAHDCAICDKKFHTFRRKHRCRSCGNAVCGNCARTHKVMPSSFLVRHNNEPVRVCDRCIKTQTQLMQERRRTEDAERARARQHAALQEERISRMAEQVRLDQLLAEQLELEERQKASHLRALEFQHFGPHPERRTIRRRRSFDESAANPRHGRTGDASLTMTSVAKTAPKDLDVFISDAQTRALEILDMAGVKHATPQAPVTATAAPTPIQEATAVPEAEDECAICLDTMEVGNAIYTTACGHSFHWACLKGIQKSDVSNADKCPSCRATMEEMQVKMQCDHPRVRLGHRYCRDCGNAVSERDAKPRPNNDGTPNSGGIAPPPPTPPQPPASYRASAHGALVRCPQCQIQMRVLPHMYNMRVACPSGHMFLVQVAGQAPGPGPVPGMTGGLSHNYGRGGRAPPRGAHAGYPGSTYYRSPNYSEL